MEAFGEAAAACGFGADSRSRDEGSWGGMEKRLGQGHIASKH